VAEDIIVGGFGAIEMESTGDERRPVNLYPVDGATIRLRADWDGKPDSPRYTQVTGRVGPEATVTLNDDELIYIKLNPRTHTPFGLGRLEVAFETINAFLGANRHAAKLASNSVVQYALWLKGLQPAQHERLIRWWQDDIEGTGRVPLLSTEDKPEVLRFAGGTDGDLYLEWQQFLLRMIANAFDLPPMFLGLEHDVNRSTAEAAMRVAFQAAIVPTAKLFAQTLTRELLSKKLGWRDLEFVFKGLEAQDPRELAELHEILIRSGVLTVNEARALRGMPALDVFTAETRRRGGNDAA
jgi:HK97 family phage portal protein